MKKEQAARADQDAIPLVLSEEDLDAKDRKKLQVRAEESRVLEGEDRTLQDMVTEALPKAVSKRVQSMLPDDFQITELQFKLAVSGKLFGSGVSGEVLVKMGPKK